VLSILFLIFFLYSTGLTDQFTGGAAMLHSNKNDPFLRTTRSVCCRMAIGKKSYKLPVYADVIAGLKLNAFANIQNVNNDLFPSTIYRDSYVFLSNTNVNREISYLYFDGDTISYNTPIDFLNQNKNLIYNNGDSEIYK